MRNEKFLEKYVPTIRKNCFFWQENRRKWNYQENVFLWKLALPNFNNGFQQEKKNSKQKHIVSTRQKVSFHQPELKISLKNTFLLDAKNYHWQESLKNGKISRQEYFLKTGFRLFSIIVSTNRNKSCKIRFCLGEIVFFYSEFFASGHHYWNYVEVNL